MNHETPSTSSSASKWKARGDANRRLRFALGVIFVSSILLTPQSSQASDLLRPDLHSLAEKIAAFLKEERQTSIAVGNFSSPPALLASS
ncbi:MAG: hypothetical protein KC931_01950, partial [Candidatus Omnitrophica bacterium]|nr:hypothetical protein [Candidatus Omnitrophota bacterium]